MRIYRYILIELICISTLLGCTHSDPEILNGEGEAMFVLNVPGNMNAELVGLDSRTATAEIPDSISLQIISTPQNQTVKSYRLGGYNGVFKRVAILDPGTYNCKVFDVETVSEALLRDERGSAWYFAMLDPDSCFTIATERRTEVAITLGVANSAVNIVKDGTFTPIFDLTKVAVFTEDNPNRTLDYVDMDGLEAGWFKAGENIKLKVFFTYKGQNFYKILDLNRLSIAGSCHVITVKPALGGTGSIEISVDNGVSVVYKLVYLNVDGSVVIGSATGTFVVGADGEMNKEDGNMDFDPDELETI